MDIVTTQHIESSPEVAGGKPRITGHRITVQNVVITQDADFLRLHASGLPHRGIVYAHQQTPVSHILRSLMLLHDVLSPDDMVRHVEFL